MRNVFTIGEAVYDIIFKDGQPKAARPGGAMLNTAVTLGRLNVSVHFIGEYANDATGKLIDNFLETNRVKKDYIYKYNDGKTPVALAFLDENNDANYTFYKIYPSERLQIDFPPVKDDDIVIFGSFYSLTPEVRKPVIDFISKAKSNNALIIYDPNIRMPHKNEIDIYLAAIEENIHYADLVRASDEDFRVIFNINDPENAYEITRKNNCMNLIYTMNKDGVLAISGDFRKYYPVMQVETTSTVGAGDSFNAGLIYAILQRGITRAELLTMNENDWDVLIGMGTEFGTAVCQSFDNYISWEMAEDIRCGL